MSLNEDVLDQIFEELNDDKNSLYSCLLVNRIWCATAVPVLWRNPNLQYNFNPCGLRYYCTPDSDNSMKTLFNTILLHLSEESRDNLKNQGININDLITGKYKYPLFNYINFWKYLNLLFIEDMICNSRIEKSKVSIVRDEILKLFINKNINFIHLTILKRFFSFIDLDYQIHHILGFEYCFSRLESIHCNNYINNNVLEELAKICKSIKKLRFDLLCQTRTNGIIKLIEAQENLNDVNFSRFIKFRDQPFMKNLGKSLIKHANTIQYLKINQMHTIRIISYLSHFSNLLKLEIIFNTTPLWERLGKKNILLPILKILKVRLVSPDIVINIIENTKGHLSEICLVYEDFYDNDDKIKEIIRAICQNCPNLQYFKLSYKIELIVSELENLLINCQFLNELVIDTYNNNSDMDKLFIILTKFSPITLFKFEFIINNIKLEGIKLFLDNWKDRNPMLLELNYKRCFTEEIIKQQRDLAEEYKTKGIIKKYFIYCYKTHLNEDFEWH